MTMLKPLPSRYDLTVAMCSNAYKSSDLHFFYVDGDGENVLFIPDLQAEIAQLMSLIINTFYRLVVITFISYFMVHFPSQTFITD